MVNPNLLAVSTSRANSEAQGPTTTIVLLIDSQEFHLTGSQAVHLAGDLLEMTGRIMSELDRRQQVTIASDFGKIASIVLKESP